jgi:hypothetical protein
MEVLIILLVMLIILAIASSLWGHDSRETIDSPEWARRTNRSIKHHL